MDNEELKITAALYELPDGWKWVKLGEICDTLTGNTPSKKNSEYYGGDFPFFKPADLEQGASLFEATEYLSEKGKKIARYIPAHSTLICCIGSIGKSGYLLRDGTSNQQINAAIPHSNLDSKYLYFSVNAENFINQLKTKSSATTIEIINKSKLDNCLIPIPPALAEQQRIVTRIETLFAQIDKIAAEAQAAADLYEPFRTKLLQLAFSGKLTAKWRKENDVSDEREKKTLGEIVSGFKYGVSDKCDYKNTGIPVLRIPNISNGFLDFSDLKYSERETVEENYIVKKDDILIIRSNGSRDLVGKAALFNSEGQFSYGSFLIKITPSEKINAKYLVYFLNSSSARKQMFSKAKSSSGIHNINSKELSIINLNLPHIPEQEEIVRILDTVLSKARTLHDEAAELLAQIPKLKKAVLAKAFSGKL